MARMILTEEKFNLVKQLGKSGVSHDLIARIVGGSRHSIPNWLAYESWADYEKFKEELKEKYKGNGNGKLDKAVLVKQEDLDKLANYLTMAVKLVGGLYR